MLICFDRGTHQHEVLYRHPSHDYMFGIVCTEDLIYFCGCTYLGIGRMPAQKFELVKAVTPFPPRRGAHNRMMRYLWTKLAADSRVIPYGKPDLHLMNQYGSTLYVAATSWNEIWLLDLDLQLKRRIPLQPKIRDFYHLNNVFCDGTHFYVCLNRYAGCAGLGGYAKFDLDWNEVERRALGWESHALTVIEGKIMQLSSFSWRSEGNARISRKAGLMVEDEFVFEYDCNEYFCKDFSMDEDRIYIVGGKLAQREQRRTAEGVVFILNRRYELLEKHVISGLGGFNGCRFRGIDYSKGSAPAS